LGTLIVFEGIDGSGKSTQFDMLCTRLGYDAHEFLRIRFPRYDHPSSALVHMYLGGEFGSGPDCVNAYAASTFFTVDRIASYLQDWKEYYDQGGLILTDRYTTSNAIHQGAKLPPGKREAFFRWLYTYEFQLIGLPEPDHVLYMDIDATDAAERLERRQHETGTSGDIHETDISFLELCAHTGRQAADYYGWHKIPCFDGDRARGEFEIHGEILKFLQL